MSKTSDLVRLSRGDVGALELEALARVIEAGYLGMSVEVQAFEKELTDYIGGNREVVCVNTGTSALHLAVQACGIGIGDEVLVPSLTFVASFQAVSATGAKPVACEIDRDTCFLDVRDAEKRITSRTKAIMPVHYASNFEGIEKIYELAAKYNLRVIEDAAHSFGGTHNGKRIGAVGDILCFSFDGIKNITCGEGGAVVTSDQAVAEKVRDARLLGVEKDTEKRFSGQRSWDFDVTEQGWRYHMNDIMAALGRTQLKRFPDFAKKRQEIAKRYQQFFAQYPEIRTLKIDYDNVVPHLFPILIEKGCRDELRDILEENNIQNGTHYKPNHLLTKYKTEYDLPCAEDFYKKVITLPLHTLLTDDQFEKVCNVISKWIGRD
ncbi:MAG: DegT/DnrJ/EryC1/StrS family aminotransferase [Alphaproteobacteria bacterium]|nr:DegT/DnrJ/EryC1/StrS family aminotransferase [Alphaproteobacteria bacterium]